MNRKTIVIIGIASSLTGILGFVFQMIDRNKDIPNIPINSSTKISSEELFRKGLNLWDSEKKAYKNIDLAIEYYSKALENNPNNPNYLINRGYAYYYAERYTLAESDFNKILVKHPTDGSSLNGRALVWMENGSADRNKIYASFKKAYQAKHKPAENNYFTYCDGAIDCVNALRPWVKWHNNLKHKKLKVNKDELWFDIRGFVHSVIDDGCFGDSYASDLHGLEIIAKKVDKEFKDSIGFLCRKINLSIGTKGVPRPTVQYDVCLDTGRFWSLRTDSKKEI